MEYPVKQIGIKHLDWIGLIMSTELPSYAKLLAHTLATYMNRDQDMAWPSLSRIEHESSLSRSTTCKYLSMLETEGWLIRERGHMGKNTRYIIGFPVVVEEAISSASHELASTSHALGSPSHELEVVRDTDTNQPINQPINKNICTKPNGSAHANGLDFERFWQYWPDKRNKKKAKQIFIRKKFEKEDVDELIKDVTVRIQKDSQWRSGYIPHCSTYLNGERWEDEIKTGERR